MSTFTYWIALEIQGAGRVASYFTNSAPPHIGETINLTYVARHADNPNKIDLKKLYRVINVIHCPQDYGKIPNEDVPQSRLNFVKILLEQMDAAVS